MAHTTAAGRTAFAERRWRQAYEHLCAADRHSPLSCDDLERLAVASHLVGKEPEAEAFWRRAHHQLLERAQVERASRCAFWLSFSLLLRGDASQCLGWVARAQRMLDEHRIDCVEQGYLLVLPGLMAMAKGDSAGANAAFQRATALARRFAEPDLLALALLSSGQAMIAMHEVERGSALLDEALVGVAAGEVSPITAGIVYCAVILTCQRIFDVQRAHEWTRALSEWCAAQPELVSYRGQCLVHRAELMQMQGDWSRAVEEAERACEWFAGRSPRAAGRAFYQRAELHRLRGELQPAEATYQQAAANGYEPQPGLSLLRLAQGDVKAAFAAIRRVAGEARSAHGPGGGLPRPVAVAAQVEIMLAAGDLQAAAAAADELSETAAAHRTPLLRALSEHAHGSVLLAQGSAREALAALREAWTLWQQLDAPYEAARSRVLIGLACRQLDDQDTARLHLGAAASVFERLGAGTDLSALLQLMSAPTGSAVSSPLTDRELDVLRRVARGTSNRQIAAALGISEHTVARHLANIFNKLGVASRTAATAYAFEHGLL